jgi:nucleotide-binding universal stress UspA family protein
MPARVKQFGHVLCPVDFSDHSRCALRHASEVVRRGTGRLTVLFVNDPLLGTAAAAAAYDVKALDAQTTAELRRFVAGALGDTAPAPALLTTVGHPAEQIQKATERLGADLVVLGSRGLTGPGKWLFGSTTERVLRISNVPVLVTPLQKRLLRAGWARALASWPGKRALVPIDLEDYAVADVRAAVEAVRRFNAKAVLIHAIRPIRFPPRLGFDRGGYDRTRIVAARTQLDKLLKTAGGDASSRVVVGEPAAQIAAVAAEMGTGLIVLTLKRASARFGPRQGAIAYRVLSTEVAPILGLPRRQ